VIRITLQTFSHSSMFSHLNPDVPVTQSSYEPGYSRYPEVTSEVTERRTNPFSFAFVLPIFFARFMQRLREPLQNWLCFPMVVVVFVVAFKFSFLLLLLLCLMWFAAAAAAAAAAVIPLKILLETAYELKILLLLLFACFTTVIVFFRIYFFEFIFNFSFFLFVVVEIWYFYLSCRRRKESVKGVAVGTLWEF
jgi:hypothetical protein